MRNRHVADVGLAHDRLRVADGAGARGAVTGVADTQMTLEMGKILRVEHGADEPHPLLPPDFLPIAHCDSGRFLTPVLDCEKPEESDSRRLLVRCVDTYDAAFFFESVILSLALRSIHAVEFTRGDLSSLRYVHCEIRARALHLDSKCFT